MGCLNCYKDVLPFAALVATECSSVGLNTLFKAASLQGFSFYIYIFYSYALNTLILLPITLIFYSKTELHYPGFPVIWRICLLGLLGVSAHMLGYKGIEFSSPTLSSAMSNLMPAFTFTFAIIFRMEKLDFRSSSFQAKIIGTTVSISGALLIVFYKGPTILSIHQPQISNNLSMESSHLSNWVAGGCLSAAQSLLFSLWFIILTKIMKMYPAELIVTLLFNFCVTIMALPVCLIAESNFNSWRLRSNTAVITLVCSVIFGPSFLSIVHSWTLHLKGPVYVAIFKPLSIAIAVVMGVIFLGDALHLGSVIGALILSSGVYAVIWGKAKEEKMSEKCDYSKIHLLQSEVQDP